MKDYSSKINLLFFLVTLFLIYWIPWRPGVWVYLSDPWDYLEQSYKSFFDKELYSPNVRPGFFPRPFTVPLFYHIVNSGEDAIVHMQKLIHATSAFFLTYSLMLFLSNRIIKYLTIICVYALMSWWNIMGWTIMLLSESLSISLLFCWLASFLLFMKKKSLLSMYIHLVLTFFFAFTRDPWPYIIVIFYILSTLMFFITDKRLLKKNILFLTFSILLLYVEHLTAEKGFHYKNPLTNNIVLRILPDSEYTSWFENHGMPNTEQLKRDAVGADDDNNRNVLYKIYKDSSYKEFFSWVREKGERTYIQFMLIHPTYPFLINENKRQLKKIFSYNLSYAGFPRGYSRLVENIFPVFSWWAILILDIILLIFFIKFKRQIFLFPFLISLVFALHILVSYNGDAIEVDRHLITTNIIVQFLGFFSLALILDTLNYKRLLAIFEKSTSFIS